MHGDILIFDRARVRENRDRAASHRGHDFLHRWVRESLYARLDDIRRDFDTALCIGAGGASGFPKHAKIGKLIHTDISGKLLRHADGPCFQSDEEQLPVADGTLDLVLSPLSLHTTNDLPGALVQIRRALRPDGFFLGAMLGGETLHELRDAMHTAELAVRDGVSPRVAPFADKPQAGALLQRAGFSLPVIDSDVVTVTYGDVFALMRDLRLMGEGNALIRRDKTIPPRSLFAETAGIYAQRYADPDGRIRASFEIIFLSGWAPHESQQKPSLRGSATHSLADFLET